MRKFPVLAALAVLVILVGAPPTRADAIKIKVGVGPVTGDGPVFIAQDRGYFVAEGLDADAISFDAAQSVAQGVVAGSLDFGTTAATAAAYNLAAKGGLKIIAGLGREVPNFHGSAFLASNRAWNAGLKSLKDMEHHSIGIVQIGGPIHYEFELAVEKYGLDPKTMRLVPLQTLSNVASAVAGGEVDVGIEVNTIALRLVNAHQAHLLAWVGNETPWQNTIIFTSSKIDSEQPKLIEAFLRAYKKGARDYYDAFTGPDGKRRDGPTAPAILAILAKHLHEPVKVIDEGISYDDPDARLDIRDVERQVAWFKSQRMLPADANAKTMMDMRFVQPLPKK
jgi:NitT/TauT family transport system substrate-binding protein